MDWSSVDWNALERLRGIFLQTNPAAAPGPYWREASDLASYDFTLGRRIAWKWAAVLEPLLKMGWRPPARTLVDWGCGSGVASRSVLAYAGPESFDRVVVWDHAPSATRFAQDAIRERYPQLEVIVADPADSGHVRARDFVLVLSHVLNELDDPSRRMVLDLASRASAVIWVEPGTYADSRALIAVREELRAVFHCVAPCTHSQACGMLTPENSRHWCHFFARAPTESFTDSGWAAFARRMDIDLRSLPYSYLVLDRRPPEHPADMVRLIGVPRRSTGVMRLLRSGATGVAEPELQKREAPELWRTLEKGRHIGTFRWKEERGRIIEGQPWP